MSRQQGVGNDATQAVKIHCPWHREKTPSLCVDLGQDRYLCFGCGREGPIAELVQGLDGTIQHLLKEVDFLAHTIRIELKQRERQHDRA